MVPLPDPLAAPVIVSQLESLDAVHVQPAVVVTVKEPVPPVLAMDLDVGEIT